MLEIIYGINPVEMAINHHKVKKIYTDLNSSHNIYKKAIENKIRIFPMNEFNDLEKYKDINIQKIIAIIEPYKYSSFEELFLDMDKNILILDKINDPQNFGAIIRSAAAFKIKYIIIPKDNSIFVNSTVHKTSSGATFLVKIIVATSFQNVLKKLKESNYWIASLDMTGNISLEKLNLMNLNLAIILGSEGDGIRKSILDQSDFIVSIPISPNVESLNVSATASITFYELSK